MGGGEDEVVKMIDHGDGSYGDVGVFGPAWVSV
jgi:hypothetical protein